MNYSFREWVNIYLETFAKRSLKPSTFQSYIHYATHININKYLADVETIDFQMVINEMVDSGLRSSTVKHTATVMRQAVLKAEQLGYCKRALWYGIVLPPADQIEAEAFTHYEINALKNDCVQHNSIYSDLFLFLMNTGLRVGEAIALKRFSDIDIKNKLIHIRGTAYKGKIYDPKSKAAFRSIPLNPIAHSIILRQPICGQFLFSNSDGNMIKYRSLLESWKFTLKRCGINQCGLHKLRHTFATQLLSSGADIKSIQQLLGHSSPDITMKYYLHPDIEQLRNVINLL